MGIATHIIHQGLAVGGRGAGTEDESTHRTPDQDDSADDCNPLVGALLAKRGPMTRHRWPGKAISDLPCRLYPKQQTTWRPAFHPHAS